MTIEQERLLKLALRGLEADRAQIDNEIEELKSQLGGPVSGSTKRKVGRKKGSRISKAHRDAISKAMKKRWVERKKAEG